jgi:aryl-alcohol dehydrogenase-like predicted oxidoreductase
MGGFLISSWGAEYPDAKAALHRALDLGINFIDTAPMYANSEEVIGKALEGVSKEVIICTKLGYEPEPFDPKDKDCLRRSFENSLRLLKRDYIDILMIHEPDRKRQFDWWTDWKTYDGPAYELMQELKAVGKIGFTGMGGTTAYEMAHIVRTGKFDVVLTAFNYSLLWREAEHEILPAARQQNMGIVCGSPLQQGALAQRYDVHKFPWLSKPRRDQYLALYAFLDEIKIPLPELCLRFVISNPDISCVLTGSRSKTEVEENVASVEKGPLPQDVLRRLDKIAATVPFRPFDEPFGLPFTREYPGAGRASR